MKIQSFIICDDVRQESNGKHILIGVYDEDMLLPKGTKWPISMVLSFYCRLKMESIQERFDSLNYRLQQNGITIVEGRGTVKIIDPDKPIILIQRFPVRLEQADLNFEVSFQLKEKIIATVSSDYSLKIHEVDSIPASLT